MSDVELVDMAAAALEECMNVELTDGEIDRLIALARIGAAVQSLRTSAIYYEGALGVKLVPSESGEPLLHMIADSLSALPQVKP